MTARAWLGLAFLAVMAASAFMLLRNAPGAGTLARRLVDHATGQLHPVAARFEAEPELFPGDPVYTVEGQSFALAGRVVGVRGTGPWRIEMELDPAVVRRFRTGSRAVAMKPGRGLGWILRTLVPPALRQDFLQDLGSLWAEQGPRTLAALRGPALALLGDLLDVLVHTLPEVLERHRGSVEAFAVVAREEVWARQLQPVVDAELAPRLEARLDPLAAGIGAEIWERVGWGDVLAVLWTGTKEKVGLAEGEEVEARLAALVRGTALPVLEQRGPELLREALAALGEAWSEERVQSAVAEAAWTLLQHPRFEHLASLVARDWLVDNPRLRERLDQAWSSRALRTPLDEAYAALEPLLEGYLEEILTRADRQGMDHQLVRALRSVVLKKDERYLLLDPGPGRPIVPEHTVLEGAIGADL